MARFLLYIISEKRKGEYGVPWGKLYTTKNMSEKNSNSKPIRWSVFIPCFLIVGGAAILGIVNNAWLTEVTKAIFTWSLGNFGWLYQVIAVVTLILVTLQRRNNYFGGRQYREVFEENRALITELKKILSR